MGGRIRGQRARSEATAALRTCFSSPWLASPADFHADIAQTTRYNWLDDTFWLKAAYHASRTPLVIHSNWWLLCAPDPTIPSDFVVPDGQFTDWQISRATLLASRYLDFKLRLDRYAGDTIERHR